MTGRVFKIETFAGADGPGIRCAVFFQGCHLRCVCCHNPESWASGGGEVMDSREVLRRALRYRAYYSRGGGVTFTGGEPLMQPEFLAESAHLCAENGLHTALDTAGAPLSRQVKEALRYIDLVLLDIKRTTEDEYRSHCGGSLSDTLRFLKFANDAGANIWVRHVVIPGLTDGEENILRLKALCAPYSNVKRIELLPFRNLCAAKYKNLGIPFALSDVPECGENDLARLLRLVDNE